MQKSGFSLDRTTVLLSVIGVSLLFFFMVKGFLMAIILSAIFSGVMYGVFEYLTGRLGNRRSLAGVFTILAFVFVVLVPMVLFTLVVVEQAIDAGRTLVPKIRERIEHPESFADELEAIGIVHTVFPDREKLLNTLDNGVNSLGKFLADGLSQITAGTVHFLFNTFIFLFSMYYFLLYGKGYLNKMLFYFPLRTSEERLLLEKFVTVTRSTLKGTLIIGVVQGALGAGAMAVAGVGNTLFWGVVMAVLSIIPAIGPGIIWAPAGVMLILGGHLPQGIGLILFGVIVIGNIDNFMRPRLMGRETSLPDLMILFGTLGGLALFGMSGIIIGPIVAALFVTLWEIYGETFKDQLQPVELLDEGD